MSRRVARFYLPFAVPSGDREKAFTKNMEMAAILCLAEAEKDKGGGLILKRTAEELVFVAEALYPLWLAPWGGRNLLFDGFSLLTHTRLYNVLPDIQAFVNELQGSAGTREAYSAFLHDYLNYFQDFTGEEEKTIEGLIGDPYIIRDLVSYLPEAKGVKKPMVDKIILSPTLGKSSVKSSAHELSGLKASLKNDVQSLHRTMKLLSATTIKHAKAVREGIRKATRGFKKRRSTVRTSIMKETRKIQRKYDQEITKRSREFEQQLQSLHQKRVKAEKERQRLPAEMDRCEAEIKSCRLRKDRASELRWRKALEKHKKRISALEKSLKGLDKRIEEVNAARRLEISKLRAEYDVQAKAAMEKLRELEAAHEAETRVSQQEMEKLEELSSTIINQMDKLMERKREALKEVEEIGIPKKRGGYALLHLPFYIACYRREKKNRYMVYPPSLAGGLKTLTRFKGALGATKIKSLLQPRSKPLTNLLNQLITLIRHNPLFEKEICDTGVQTSILQAKESRKRIKKGLKELKGEGWISESEILELDSIITA